MTLPAPHVPRNSPGKGDDAGEWKWAAEPFTSRSWVQIRTRLVVTEKPSSSAADLHELFPAKQAHITRFYS